MTVEERETRPGKKYGKIDEYLKDSLIVPEEDENENYQFYLSHEAPDYHVRDKEELETDEQYMHFLMDLPLDEKAKLYELWERSISDERVRLAEASDKRVVAKTIAIALNLLKWGMKSADIAKVTGLSAEEVERLNQAG